MNPLLLILVIVIGMGVGAFAWGFVEGLVEGHRKGRP
jgi:hypothetical protein